MWLPMSSTGCSAIYPDWKGGGAMEVSIVNKLSRRRLLTISSSMTLTAVLAACGGSGAKTTSTPAPTASGGAQVTISSPTAANASVAAAASPSIAVTRAELKGKITIARQPASPLSNGKEDP